MKQILLTVWSIFACLAVISAQPSNDDCSSPIRLSDITKYCSKAGEYTTVGATPSGYGASTCWPNAGEDVWFSFRAFASDVAVTIIGRNVGGTPQGSLTRIMASMYAGVCGGTLQEINCVTDTRNAGAVTMYEGGLVVGRDYLIRISGMGGAQGTFQLCINNFFPPAMAAQDCRRATVLCDNNPFVNQTFSGSGLEPDEAFDSCLGEGGGAFNNSESQSTWYTWVSKTDCNLTFTITPLNSSDDIDFAVYELPNGTRNCAGKIILRCNATAPPCTGPTGKTGLNLTATDTSENFNCNVGEDGFCKFLPMKAGVAYALVINNFTNTGIGFSMEWGDCEFNGPEPDFRVLPDSGLKCDTDFLAIDSTRFAGGIRVRDWNFGVDAVPPRASGVGPHRVNYFSFGEKFITLTLETNEGCRLTEVRRINVLPCCEDLPTLRLSLDSIFGVKCFGDKDGRVVFRGLSGTPFVDQDSKEPFYQFSLDGVNFQPASEFNNLPAGNYTLWVQDAKGCISSFPFTIDEPAPITVDLGPDLTINLGDRVQLTGAVSPGNLYTYNWGGFDPGCTDCPVVDFLPVREGFHYLTVTNSNGCLGLDSVFIKINKPYPIYIPNAISPNGDGINDFFSVSGDVSLAGFELVEVYDRWGGRVFSRSDIAIQDANSLWDGRSGGVLVNPGVFTYLVKARFIDDEVVDYSGDLTVIR